MNKTRLDDHVNGLIVAAVVALSIGLNVSVFADNIAQTADGLRATAAAIVAPPSSEVMAMLLASQMPR